MCGGGGIIESIEKPFQDVGKLITHPNLKNLENVGHDVVNAGENIGAYYLGGPLGVGALNAGKTALQGGGVGDSLKSAVESAGLSYGGQQLAGAAGEAFPETTASISNAIPNLGISDTFSSVAKSLGFGGSVTPGGGDGSPVSAPSGVPSTASAAPAGGGSGVSAGGSAAPAGVTPDTGLPWLDSNVTGTGSSVTSSPNIGSGTVGTQSLPSGVGSNLTSQFSQAAGGAPTLNTSVIDSLASGGGSSGVGAASSAPSSVESFLAKPGLSTAFDVVKANPGVAISAAGLGLDALKGNQALEGENELKQEAANLAGQGNKLQSYLESGTLPPGLQQGINQASEAAKATIRSQYASRGMSGSSAEQQDLASVDSRAQAEGSQMAMQLLQTGINETGLASGLYEKLLANAMKTDEDLSTSISNFASAAAGGGQSGRGGVTINYPQAA